MILNRIFTTSMSNISFVMIPIFRKWIDIIFTKKNFTSIKITTYLFIYLGGPYSGFSGRDASRGLATFNVNAITDEYDDLSDLKPSEIEQVILL